MAFLMGARAGKIIIGSQSRSHYTNLEGEGRRSFLLMETGPFYILRNAHISKRWFFLLMGTKGGITKV